MDNFIFSIMMKQQQKQHGNKSNEVCMAEAMQRLDEMLGRVNSFAMS
jgi:hypothetical protein